MEAAKEKISNIYASAKAGMDKTKATAEEKVEKLKTKDPLQKNMAEERKEEKIRQAELEKQQVIRRMLKGEAQHTGVEHQTGGHHTSEGHQTSLGKSTDGVTGQQRTDAQTVGTKTNLIGH